MRTVSVRVFRMSYFGSSKSSCKRELPNATMTVLAAHCACFSARPGLIGGSLESARGALLRNVLLIAAAARRATCHQFPRLILTSLAGALSQIISTTGLRKALQTAKPTLVRSTSRCSCCPILRFPLHSVLPIINIGVKPYPSYVCLLGRRRFPVHVPALLTFLFAVRSK
jgi:hypothetical protein